MDVSNPLPSDGLNTVKQEIEKLENFLMTLFFFSSHWEM
jgi:hypothetical protein